MIFAIVIIAILLTLAYFYLKCSTIASFSMMMLFVIASIITFTYYEPLANVFISRGYGIQWAHVGCFVLIFVLSFALLRALSDFLIGSSKIDLGNPVKIGSAVICGLISGLIISGCILIAVGLVPSQHKLMHNRFEADDPISLNNPQKAFLNTDGFVTGLYSLISRGSLASSKSFPVLHADFLSQVHLNRTKVNDDVLPVASQDCLKIPSGAGKKAVRVWDIPDHGKATVVRVGIAGGDIKSGGAGNPVTFCPAHLRMVCKESIETKTKPLAGSGKAVWPVGFLKDGKLIEIKLGDLVPDDVKLAKSRVIWLDVVFDVPSGHEGILLEFKQNAVAELPSAVPSTDEIEGILDGKVDGVQS